MGAIKFFNGGQSATEIMLFGRYNITTFVENYTMSALPEKMYSDSGLTTEATKEYPYVYYSTSSYPAKSVLRFSHPDGNNSVYYKASSDSTHDKTLYTFHNVVADVSVLSEALYNGVKEIALSLTNNGNEIVTVKSLQRSNLMQAVASASATGSSSNSWYLDWAYYLDESEWITLAAGETKTITLTINISDLTA
jgi:hypothetical protein